MRKEVLFAIIAGVSIGLILAFGIWNVTKVVKRNPTKTTKIDTPIPKNLAAISISSLSNYSVVNKNPTINGLTSPNTDIVISTLEADYHTKSNSEGEFNTEIELPPGLSEIKISLPSLNEDGQLKLLLVYSTEVEENLRSYVGTITDISSETIQVKGLGSNILQVSTFEETKFINTFKKNIEVKQTDLAIGDHIVAMGKVNGNKVLKAERVLISTPPLENKIDVKTGTIESLSKTKINDIVLPKTWIGPNVSELEVGQKIIVTGTTTDKKFDLRTLIVIQ